LVQVPHGSLVSFCCCCGSVETKELKCMVRSHRRSAAAAVRLKPKNSSAWFARIVLLLLRFG
jgi:hypothetical protein